VIVIVVVILIVFVVVTVDLVVVVFGQRGDVSHENAACGDGSIVVVQAKLSTIFVAVMRMRRRRMIVVAAIEIFPET
jgi:hypothetical protein